MEINRKELFKEYLLKRLGYVDDDFLGWFLAILPFTRGTWKSLDVVNYLFSEYSLRRNAHFTRRKQKWQSISATDLASYTFCPVSLSISKTFDIPKDDKAIIGTQLHEQSPLKKFCDLKSSENVDGSKKKPFASYMSESNKAFFEDLEHSVMQFHGHDNSHKKGSQLYFKSEKGLYVGQPDYIFKNADGKIFVIEEKFQSVQKRDDLTGKPHFHRNHLDQVISYMHGIIDYNIEYAYLIYWEYETNYGHHQIYRCSFCKILRSEQTRAHIQSLYIKVKNFQKVGLLDFDISSRNYRKCAYCVVNRFCGHKTGRYDRLTFPYSQEYLKLFYSIFPDELKNSK